MGKRHVGGFVLLLCVLIAGFWQLQQKYTSPFSGVSPAAFSSASVKPENTRAPSRSNKNVAEPCQTLRINRTECAVPQCGDSKAVLEVEAPRTACPCVSTNKKTVLGCRGSLGSVVVVQNVLHDYSRRLLQCQSRRWLSAGGCNTRPTFRVSGNLQLNTPCLPIAFSVAHPFGTNLYHFFAEILPQLLVLRPFLLLFPNAPVVVSQNRWNYLIKMLLPEVGRRIFTLRGRRKDYVFVNSLILPVYEPCGQPLPALVKVSRANNL
eukprot:TRINITY_DN4294_c0_g1_i3.p1 TRINITY_DN4294_c0_g1~~TRINITY_DN4294_c0_g1_i3.p1  ORF type:complete len:264 (+),score=17.65 TRINITY_DN4294_c0_g1_i3:72-863(+)